MKIPLKIRWHQIAISLLLGFALGTAFGQWHAKENFHAHWRKDGGMKQHLLERFNRELHLSADQKKKIEAIFDAKHPEMFALQAEVRPKFEALRNSAQAEIQKILDPEQRKKFDQMNARMEERWKERKHFFVS